MIGKVWRFNVEPHGFPLEKVKRKVSLINMQTGEMLQRIETHEAESGHLQ